MLSRTTLSYNQRDLTVDMADSFWSGFILGSLKTTGIGDRTFWDYGILARAKHMNAKEAMAELIRLTNDWSDERDAVEEYHRDATIEDLPDEAA